MPGQRTDSPAEEIPLPKLESPRPHDYVPRKDLQDLSDVDREQLIKATQKPHDSDSDSSGTDSGTEFDWDAEDDASGRKVETTVHAKRGRLVYHTFMRLSKFVRTLIVAILGAGILITPLLVFQLKFTNTPGRIQAHVWSLWAAVSWAAGCATYLIVDVVPSVAVAIFRLFTHRVERLQMGVELTAAVLGWLKLVLDVSWMWIALSVIRAVYKPPGSYWTIVNRVMQALFSASVLLLAEKIFLRYVAINFHRRALADRIEENQIGLRALDRLSNATPNTSARKSPYGPPGWKRGHRTNSNTASVILENQASSSTSSPIGEKQEDIRHELEKAKKKEKKQRRKRPNVAVIVGGLMKNSKYTREGETLYSASKLARKLFASLSRVHPREYLVVDDFTPYFKSQADAQAAFAVFDKDGNGDITKKEMREAVRRIYRERRALTASLKDVGSAVAKLDAVLIACVLVVLAFICLLIFNRDNTIASLVPLATIILGFSFIFGHSAQTLFESLIFIFSTHVFDVGDLVMIDDQPLFVREFGLFSTTFTRVDGQEIVAPNALLANSKLVHNLRRSNSMWETTNLMVSFDTPLENIETLRRRLEDYVNDDKNRREWSGVALNIEKMEFQNAIHLIVAMEHRPNWQDWGGRWARRTQFMRFLKSVLEELDMRYTMPVQPVLMPNPPADGLRSPRSPRSPFSSSPRMRQPQMPRFDDGLGLHPNASRDTLGNAGSFQGGEMHRAPSRSLRP